MKVFVSHSTHFDYKNELYKPIQESSLFTEHDFFFPHDTERVSNTKGAIQNVYEVIVAEVSFPSTGLGIELGWANDAYKKIICVYKKGSNYTSSLTEISDTFIEYSDSSDLVKNCILFYGLKVNEL